MKFVQFLNERYLNLFLADKDDREKYKNEVYDMIQVAYKKIGGFKGSGFNSPDDMVAKIPMWKLVRRGDKIKACMLYKDKDGRKTVCMASDGTKEGRAELSKMIGDDGNRSYTEISSNALDYVVYKHGIEFVLKNAISIKDIEKALGTKTGEPEQSYIDKYPELKQYFYSRKIGKDIETKIAIGLIGIPIKP